MKKFFILMIALLCFSACKQEELIDADADGSNGGLFKVKPETDVDKSKINGLWEAFVFSDAQMSQKSRILFDEKEEKVSMASECKYFDGNTLYIQVEAAAVFKNFGTDIANAEQDYKKELKNGITYECFASIPAGFLKMSLNGKINLDGAAFSKIAD